MKFKSILFVVAVLLLLFTTIVCSWAITRDEATIVGQNFIRYVLEVRGGWEKAEDAYIIDCEELRREDMLLGYHLSIYPEGHIVISSLKQLVPVKSFSTTCSYDTKSEKGYWALLKDVLQIKLLFIQQKYGTLNEEELPEQISSASNEVVWQWLRSGATSPEMTTVVGPIVETRWNQQAPFNDYCPMGDGGLSVAGCVAIAAAQIMRYWAHPSSGTASHSYWWDGDGSVPGRTLSATFSDSYDWNNMLSSYSWGYSNVQADAVAELCYEVGVAFEMDYRAGRSGANPNRGLIAFPSYFKYKNTIAVQYRINYSSDTWFERIKEELNSSPPRPMMYYIWDGNQDGFAHEIVCDGYWENTTDYIHMNYGWAGSSDNWYAVDSLDCDGPCDYLKESMLTGIEPMSSNNAPYTPPSPSGPDTGIPDTSYSFTATTTDSDGDQVAFKFDWGDGTESGWTSLVNSGSSGSMSHSWSGQGTYQVRAKAKDVNGAESGWSGAHEIVIGHPPNTPSVPTGPDSGRPNISYDFTASSTDPDGDQVALKFDWGNGSVSGWSPFADSGSSVSMSHSWLSEGTFQVKAQSKDIYGAESGWSAGHGITIILSQPPATPAPPGSDGGTRGPEGISYTFTATTTDPEGEQIAFEFDWGDGTGSGWTSFVDSGSSVDMLHTWLVQGTLEVKVRAKDVHGVESGWSAPLTIVTGQAPNTPAAPGGPDRGGLGSSHSFSTSSTDSDGDQVALKFDWGDGNESGWSSFADSGSSVNMSHSWSSEGTFQVKAQSKDIYGAESGWSAGHGIEILEGYHENETLSLPAGKWKMISIPFILDDPSPNAVLVDDLGEQNDAVWKLYRWSTSNESYDKYPNIGNFSPGKASSIISKDTKTVDTGPGRDVSRQTDFVINLLSGWSQIANPFPFSIDWNEVRVRRNAEVVGISEAQARGWLRDKIWFWDGQSYLVYQAPSGIIDPYEGYWVKALVDCELLMPPNESQQARTFEQGINSKEEFLQLKAKVGELEDNFNFLGFSESAKDGYDRLDIEEAPPISPYISLFFPHPEWEKNKGDYTQDIRTRSFQAGLGWTWDFQAKTDQVKKEIIFEWENTSVISEELHLYLTDSSNNVLVDMKEKNSYRFTLPNGLESFKVIATYEALPLPKDLNLTEVYSYPNPARGTGAKLHFNLASWAEVTIKIYAINGELVRILIEDKAFLAGAHEELWEERNDKGEKLARGVYIFIVQADNPAKVIRKSGKIALLE